MPQRSLPDWLGRKCALYLSASGGRAFLRGKALIVGQEGAEREICLNAIRRVILIGKARIDSEALAMLLRLKIPVDWLDVFGKPLGMLVNLQDERHSLCLRQEQFRQSPQSLELMRVILLAKLANCQEVLLRKEISNTRWHDLRKGLLDAADEESLRGAEGIAAKWYFSHWGGLLHDFSWHGRHARPAPDPVNMLLSTGYSLLANRLASALWSVGLDSRIGFFHHGRGCFQALAYDLIEPLRAFVDLACLGMIRLGKLKPEQFQMRGERCVVAGRDTFAAIMADYEEMFCQMRKLRLLAGGEESHIEASLNDCMELIACSFRNHLEEGSEMAIPLL